VHAAIHGKYVPHIENLPPVESMITPGPAHQPLKPDVFTAEKPPEGAPGGGQPKLTNVMFYITNINGVPRSYGLDTCRLRAALVLASFWTCFMLYGDFLSSMALTVLGLTFDASQ